MTDELNIDVTQVQGQVPVTVFRIKGDIDANTFDQLQERAEQAYADGTRYLLLDLSEVPYISSSGIRGLHHIVTLLRSDSPAGPGSGPVGVSEQLVDFLPGPIVGVTFPDGKDETPLYAFAERRNRSGG